ncbi:unnamed protein product [Microthlaspi erraticum]|uniref:Uncharacterized protein n=1 Tax=Microthlaspi erraticum TaxID=1685480 RepID=A0A6D2KM34_9BRAS|nr:unnamed protein product [Microthlaspi erraticum]
MDTKDKVSTPKLPSKNRVNSVEYVGKWGDKFTVMSLVTSDEVDQSFISNLWAFHSDNAAWKLIEADLKIEFPNRICINIENHIYFLSERCKDVIGIYDDLVVSFEMINEKIELLDLPIEVVSLPTKRLMKLGGLALAAYNNVREENFEIWRFNERDKT